MPRRTATRPLQDSHGRREWSADGPRTAIHQLFLAPKGCACKKQLTFPCQLDALGSDHMILNNLANFLHARARLNFRALYLGDQQTSLRCQHRMKLLRHVDGDYGADRSCCVVMDKQFHFSPLLADDAKVHAIAVDVGSPNVFDIEQKPAATTRVCDYADVLYT